MIEVTIFHENIFHRIFNANVCFFVNVLLICTGRVYVIMERRPGFQCCLPHLIDM